MKQLKPCNNSRPPEFRENIIRLAPSLMLFSAGILFFNSPVNIIQIKLIGMCLTVGGALATWVFTHSDYRDHIIFQFCNLIFFAGSLIGLRTALQLALSGGSNLNLEGMQQTFLLIILGAFPPCFIMIIDWVRENF